MRRFLLTAAVLFLASLLAVDVPAVVPTSATTPSGTGVTINSGSGILETNTSSDSWADVMKSITR